LQKVLRIGADLKLIKNHIIYLLQVGIFINHESPLRGKEFGNQKRYTDAVPTTLGKQRSFGARKYGLQKRLGYAKRNM